MITSVLGSVQAQDDTSTYISEDGNFSLVYSNEWDLTSAWDRRGASSSIVNYSLDFELEDDISISISILDAVDGDLYVDPNMETPYELILESGDESIEQFSIGEYEAISSVVQRYQLFSKYIVFGLNDRWFVRASIDTSSEDEFEAIKPILFTTLESIELAQTQDDFLSNESGYVSEDNAIQLNYPSDWTIEEQDIIFGEYYRFVLRTSQPNPFGGPPRSRILFELIDRNDNDMEDLETPLEFVEDALAGFVDFDDVQDLTLLDSPSVRVAFGNTAGSPTILYSIVLNDEWVILASILPEEDKQDTGEDDLLFILESIEFDLEAASTPFVRDLDEYDFGDVALTNDYVSEDANLSLSYSDNWNLADTNEMTNFSSLISYMLQFEQDDVAINIGVFDVTDGGLNAPPDANSPYEVMLSLRQSDADSMEEFLINEYEVVSTRAVVDGASQQTIVFALNNNWLVQASVKASSEEELDAVEPTFIATLASLEFAVGASYIASPVLNVELPEPWGLGLMEFENGVRYEFILRPSDNDDPNGPRILIQIADLEPLDLLDVVEDDGLDGLLELILPDGLGWDEIMIADYEAVQTEVISPDEGLYASYTIMLLEEKWIFLAYTAGFDEDIMESLQEDINTIIETMEITLPEDD